MLVYCLHLPILLQCQDYFVMIIANYVRQLNIAQSVLILRIQALLYFIMAYVIILALQKLMKCQIKLLKNAKIVIHLVKLVLMDLWQVVHLVLSFIHLNKLMLVLRLVSLCLGMFVFLYVDRDCLSTLLQANVRYARLIVNSVLMLNSVTYVNKVQAS